MDISLPRILPTGIGGVAGIGSQALDAARTAANSATANIGSVGNLGSAGSIGGLGSAADLTGVAGVDGASPTQNVVQSFGAVLSQAVQDLNQTQVTADQGAAKLAAGEPVDLHQVMIGMESANLSFGLALQVRNKLLDAYQEVMRMVI
jgi:flagellar hook-basal body complex protein FliE